MQNKVGNVVPSEKVIQGLVEQLSSIEGKVKAFTVELTGDERKATTKMRTGGEPIARLVGELADANGVALPKINVEGMKADLLLIERMKPLQAALDDLSQRIADTILQAQSEAWWAATAYYTTLSRMAAADAKLERSLKPAVDFFAIGRRKKPVEQPADKKPVERPAAPVDGDV
ncbi:hypothetical protein WME75_31240 [Sorangium sp. So ce1014]|uniref:hypothetical protein n=1 Tax=Sorangium sp. So ce1014 TaxID=3133326 RepID=UPI003F63DF71